MKSTIFISVAAFVVLGQLGMAQNASPEIEVAFGFLRFHNSVVLEVEKRAPGDPAGARALQTGMVALLKMTPADFDRISPISRSAIAELEPLWAQARTFIDEAIAKKEAPDKAKLDDFETRRHAIIAAAMLRLQKSLSTSGWLSLQTYLTTEFRKGYSQEAFNNKRVVGP